MADFFADTMSMPQDSTCDTFTYRFSMLPNTNLTLFLRLHMVWWKFNWNISRKHANYAQK